MNFNHAQEFKAMVKAYAKAGGYPDVFSSRRLGWMMINGNKVLGQNEIKGFQTEHKSTRQGVNVKILIKEKVRIGAPIHLCFGMLSGVGRQIINLEFFIGKGAEVKFLAHCSFPHAKRLEHLMNAKVYLDKRAKVSYVEEHYHSESGGTSVHSKIRGKVGKGGKLFEEFRLIKGRVGTLKVDYEIDQNERSFCGLLTKIYGKKDDRIEVRESLHLNGKYASGTAKSRIILVDQAFGNVRGEIEGNASYTRGHIDCQEIVHGQGAKALSTPQISVKNPLARITHEAAIGRINKKELETLMARGLSEKEAVNLIVEGFLK